MVRDDLERSRVTTFFRLILAIPHLIAVALYGLVAIFATVVNWFIALLQGTASADLHRFVAGYLRYATHVQAYLHLAANPYPRFFPGESVAVGDYPVDIEIDPPLPQNRWKTAFRIVLAVPAFVLAGALVGGSLSFTTTSNRTFSYSLGVLSLATIFAWVAILARRRMPPGLSQLIAFCISYGAQLTAYMLLLTDRYPDCDPYAVALPAVAPRRALRVSVTDDLGRSRLTVLLRLLLAIPHAIWLTLWGIVASLALIVSWLATLLGGRTPAGLHEFLARYVRYRLHVAAYMLLVAEPFPSFGGRPGYPVDVEIDPPLPQSRWVTAFRPLLALPALLLGVALGFAALACGLLGWFAALATGRMPRMLRNLAAFALAYLSELYGYTYLLTERYPYSGPVFATH